jgi:hypothetical protein
MNATTIKLDGDLLSSIESTKDRGQSVTDFVRQAVSVEIRARRLREAAVQYAQFLTNHPDEMELLHEWEGADLSKPVTTTPQRRTRSRGAQ